MSKKRNLKRNLCYAKRWIKRKFPSHWPVRVYVVSQKTLEAHSKEFGVIECDYDLDGLLCPYEPNKGKFEFKLLIDKALEDEKRVHVLFHEWAHLLCEQGPAPNIRIEVDRHCEVWKAHYGRILRIWNGDES